MAQDTSGTDCLIRAFKKIRSRPIIIDQPPTVSPIKLVNPTFSESHGPAPRSALMVREAPKVKMASPPT